MWEAREKRCIHATDKCSSGSFHIAYVSEKRKSYNK
jgi:hypothetical protein